MTYLQHLRSDSIPRGRGTLATCSTRLRRNFNQTALHEDHATLLFEGRLEMRERERPLYLPWPCPRKLVVVDCAFRPRGAVTILRTHFHT